MLLQTNSIQALTQSPFSAEALFLTNMRSLWRVDGALAVLVDAIPDEGRISMTPSAIGAATASVVAESGAVIMLHSRHDPILEAQRFADGAALADKHCAIIRGCGLGYHIHAVLNRLPDEGLVICIEPSLARIASALCCVDVAEALAASRLIILHDADKARLHERLKPLGTLTMLGSVILSHGPSMRLGEPGYEEIQGALNDFLAFTRMSMLTLVGNSEITCRNVAMNLVHYVGASPLDEWKDRFHGATAIIISAGPSLRKNINQLHEWKGRAVLIAVQTALKPLLRSGVVPDFVTTLDFHEVSRNFFDDIPRLEQTWLVAEPKATWHVLDGYPGPILAPGNSWAELLLEGACPPRCFLPSGATVAHLAFYLAEFLGCDPIVFVGQDLAFTGHVFYVPGVDIHQTWTSELNRFSTMEQKEWERIARNRPILRKITGQDGQELFNDELLFTYLEQFERDIANSHRRVINATQGGARIAGTEELPLHDLFAALAGSTAAPIQLPKAYEETSRTGFAQAITALDRRLEEFQRAEDVCEELLLLLNELQSLVDEPTQFNRRLIRVDELRTIIAQDSRAYRIVNAAVQLTELRRYSADRRISAKLDDGPQRARRQIDRDVNFVSGVLDGIRRVRPMLVEAQKRIADRTQRINPTATF